MEKLYEQLAAWWPLLSPPADYAEEAAFFANHLRAAGSIPPHTLLELGSGGGNNAFHLQSDFSLTLSDYAPQMLAVSQALLPGVPHHAGDMRSLRLNQQFDRVLIHDAICYMSSVDDLRQALQTAFVHLKPGGAAYFAPDYLRENFEPATEHGGEDAPDGRGLRYLAWTYDPDPHDTSYLTDYAYLLRHASGESEALHDRHVEGLFPRQTWLDLLRDTGFAAQIVHFVHSEVDSDSIEHFLAVKPSSAP